MNDIKFRFLLDEHVPHAIRDELKRVQPEAEVRVVGGDNAPPKSTPDAVILQFLEREGFILITSNRSTMPTHLNDHLQHGGHVPGILLLHRNYDFGQFIETFELIWGAGVPEDFQDRITRIPYR